MAETGCGLNRLVVNELLCFVDNNFDSKDKSRIINTIVEFHHEKEILEAKSELYRVGNDYLVDGKDVTIKGWSKIVTGKGHLINRRDLAANDWILLGCWID